MLENDIKEFNQLIINGLTLEAMEKFYADDVEMQENNEVPRKGKAFCIEHEKAALSKVKSLKIELLNQAIDKEKGTVFTQLKMEFMNKKDQKICLDEVSMQQWENGKIVKEKFFYKEFLEFKNVFEKLI